MNTCNCTNCKENKENLNCTLELYCSKCDKVYFKVKCFSKKEKGIIIKTTQNLRLMLNM